MSRTTYFRTPDGRRWLKIIPYSQHVRRSERNIRELVARGLLPGARLPGVRGVVLDVEATDRRIAELENAGILRKGFGTFGPNAQIRPVVAPVVTEQVGP